MRSIAMTRSSGVRNHAVADESGKKNLVINEHISQRWGRTERGLPEENGDHERDDPGDDHEPVEPHLSAIIHTVYGVFGCAPLPRLENRCVDVEGAVRHESEQDDGGAVHKDYYRHSSVSAQESGTPKRASSAYTNIQRAGSALDVCRTWM